MDEEDDLDAELALFETQIQKVKAATKPSDPPSQPSPKPVSKPAPPPTTKLTPVSTPIQQQKQASLQPTQQPQQTHHATAKKPTTTQPAAQPTSRWFWDGTTWRWRTTPTAPVTTRPAAPPAQSAAPVQVPKRPSTKRTAAGEVWNDPTLADWPTDDHRIFVGDLAPDATEKHLSDAFGVYPSFAMARVVRDKRSGACRGYGFVSFSDGRDMVRALRELNGKYVGGRPVKLKRSNWQKRALQGEKWKELKVLRKIAKK